MTTRDDGGQAFPTPTVFGGNNGAVWGESGMSLRDWFAGQALAWCLNEFGGNAEDQTHYAAAAYEIADAMLEARKR